MYLLIEADLTVSLLLSTHKPKHRLIKFIPYDGNLKAKMPVNFAVQ